MARYEDCLKIEVRLWALHETMVEARHAVRRTKDNPDMEKVLKGMEETVLFMLRRNTEHKKHYLAVGQVEDPEKETEA